MKTIKKHKGIETLLFPDNQPHVSVYGVLEDDDVKVIYSIQSSLDMMQLLLVSDALDRLHANKKELVIPYLMAARYDRPMQHGGSFDLKVVARLINSCSFDRVRIFDPHSDVTLALIENSEAISNKVLVREYNQKGSVLICPDAGAAKKSTEYWTTNPSIVDETFCIKHRDISGKIFLKVMNPERCMNRHCVIIDDLCDGGGTFLAIADQIVPKSLTLIVSHGLFSKGIARLADKFDQIITSDSYSQQTITHPKLKVIKLEL